MLGPANGGEAEKNHAGSTRGVWQQPCEPVESFVDWSRERFLAAVSLDKPVDDLISSLALRDECGNLRTYLHRLVARAFAHPLPSATAETDDRVLKIFLERRPRNDRDRRAGMHVLSATR